MEKEKFVLLPQPRKLIYQDGFFRFTENSIVLIGEDGKDSLFPIALRLRDNISDSSTITPPVEIGGHPDKTGTVAFFPDNTLGPEEYTLAVSPDSVRIGYGSPAGAFYAAGTLKQILTQSGGLIPCLQIRDSPDYPVRGLMLDISRDKIPKLDTIKRVVDLMADIKLNHLELYIEGFPFAYPSFPSVWRGGTPITGEELFALDRYCREHYIDLVPNQNSFGHMTPWLLKKEFKNLAECPDGYTENGCACVPSGLNPLNPESIHFLDTLYGDLLPNFHSVFFNVGCDETLDLGKGQSREACEQTGRGRVYLDFLLKIHRLTAKYHKRMLYWGDIITKYPELIAELPRDAIALIWGYEANEPSETDCRKFAESGIPFYVCPGTNSWNSITGRFDIMHQNLLRAATLGKKYGASGFLNTDWGDGGHLQPLPTSYPAFCYGAALSWGVENNRDVDLASYLDRFVFRDESGQMGRLVIGMDRYHRFEEKSAYNGTYVFKNLHYARLDDSNRYLAFLHMPPMGAEGYRNIRDEMTRLAAELDNTRLRCDDCVLILSEMRTAARLVVHGAELALYKLEQKAEKFAPGEAISRLEALLDDLTAILGFYRQNWLARNKYSGLDDSVSHLENLRADYAAEIRRLEENKTK